MKNETSRQVHKRSFILFRTYTQNLLVMLFRCLRMSGPLHIICVEYATRVCENSLGGSLYIAIIHVCVCF